MVDLSWTVYIDIYQWNIHTIINFVDSTLTPTGPPVLVGIPLRWGELYK